MYRDGTNAELQALRVDLARTEAARAELARQRADALAELHRMREGIGRDDALATHPPYRRMRLGLLVLGIVGVLTVAVALPYVLTWAVAEPMLDVQGLRNFVWHVRHGRGLVGIAATGFVLALAVPWAVLPLLGRRGLLRERRWGWVAALAGSIVFLMTPALPIAVLCLVVLLSPRVRAVYLAPPKEPTTPKDAGI